MSSRLRGLYVITDNMLSSERGHVSIARQALEGGARILQFREKSLATRACLQIARELRGITRDYQSLFIVNDRCDLAVAADADGVHLGQDDLPLREARIVVGHKRIIGVSVDTPDEAAAAAESGADYVSIGPIFSTKTKSDAGPVVGLDLLRNTRERISIPLAAIGGINLQNFAAVADTGADMICVVSAIALADDMREATRMLCSLVDK